LGIEGGFARMTHGEDTKICSMGKLSSEESGGDEIDELLTNWPECPAPGKKRKAPKPLLKVWKTRSVF
jgi:hypothetical protein